MGNLNILRGTVKVNLYALDFFLKVLVIKKSKNQITYLQWLKLEIERKSLQYG